MPRVTTNVVILMQFSDWEFPFHICMRQFSGFSLHTESQFHVRVRDRLWPPRFMDLGCRLPGALPPRPLFRKIDPLEPFGIAKFTFFDSGFVRTNPYIQRCRVQGGLRLCPNEPEGHPESHRGDT